MEIRTVEARDIDALAPVMTAVFNAPPWNEHWSEESAAQSLCELLASPRFYGDVILADGEIAGALLGHLRTYAAGTSFYLDEFFISPAHRRQHLATALYRHTLAALKEKNVGGLFFTTQRNSPAYAFYLREGAWDLNDAACFYHAL